MAFSRYKIDQRMAAGSQLGTANACRIIRQAIQAGNIVPVSQIRTSGFDRLDTLAGNIYGDSSYWWILAAASNIGWGLQVPPNTIINILDPREVQAIIS